MEAALGLTEFRRPLASFVWGCRSAATSFLALTFLPSRRHPPEHPGLRGRLVVGDRFGDIIEDRLDLAMRLGRSQMPRWWYGAPAPPRRVTVAAPAI